MRSVVRHIAVVLGLLAVPGGAAGCGTPTALASLDGGAQALVCATPTSEALVAPTSGPNAGIPMAGVVWNAGRCSLSTDEHAPGLVLLIADFAGTPFGLLTASAASRWRIDSSSTGSGPTTYLANIPRDTDITVQMASSVAQSVSITFRVSATNVLTLLDMHRI